MNSFNAVWNYVFGVQKPIADAGVALDESHRKLDNNSQPSTKIESNDQIERPNSVGGKATLDKCKPLAINWGKCGDGGDGDTNKGAVEEKRKSKYSDKSKPVDQDRKNTMNESNKIKHQSDQNANNLNLISAQSVVPVIPENSTVKSLTPDISKIKVNADVQILNIPKSNLSTERKGHGNGDISSKREPKKRTCGNLTVEREDLHLPNTDQSELEPVKSNIDECYKLKLAYDQCFEHWFAHGFLQGSTDTTPCQDILDKYSACVKNGLVAQDFALYQPGCYYSSDPNDHRVEKPRKKPPSGADYHQG